MTGVAFVLYTNYMITDPGTTPSRPRNQVFFGLGVAASYGLLVELHIVFGMFFALVITCAVRGAVLVVLRWLRAGQPAPAAVRTSVPVSPAIASAPEPQPERTLTASRPE
jgi:hypothetical protein